MIEKEPTIYKNSGDNIFLLSEQINKIKLFKEITNECTFYNGLDYKDIKVYDDEDNKNIFVLGKCRASSIIDTSIDLITLPVEYKLSANDFTHYNTPCPQQGQVFNGSRYDYRYPAYLGARSLNGNKIIIAAFFFEGVQTYKYGINIIGYCYCPYTK